MWYTIKYYTFNIVRKCLTRCRNLRLGLATKAKGCKVAGQEGNPGITSHALGNAKEFAFTLPSELPLWELESRIDSPNFKN
jgi:hypothetical protein